MKLMNLETIQTFISGEEKAFKSLMDNYSEPLSRYCLSILGDTEEAKDVLQETFIKAYEKKKAIWSGNKFGNRVGTKEYMNKYSAEKELNIKILTRYISGSATDKVTVFVHDNLLYTITGNIPTTEIRKIIDAF